MIDDEGEDTDPDPVMVKSHASEDDGDWDWLMVTFIAVLITGVVCFLLGLVVG